jgi:hypothetical protein
MQFQKGGCTGCESYLGLQTVWMVGKVCGYRYISE